MILNAKRIHSSFNFKEISPQELNKCLQKFYFRQEKATTADVRSLRAKIAIVGNGKWVKNHQVEMAGTEATRQLGKYHH